MEEQRRPHTLSGRTLVRAGGLAPSRETPSRAHTTGYMLRDITPDTKVQVASNLFLRLLT